VALTGIEEENILLTLHARNVSNAKVVTKINRINFRSAINTLDLGSVIYPRYITSEAIVAYVRAKHNSMNSNVETLNYICENQVEAVEFRVNEASAVTGRMLKDLKPKMKKDTLIASINRNGRILIPSGNDSIEVGDTVMVVTTHSGFNDIRDILA
jgi:trk system potassium uptake protein TrkA